MLDAEKLKMFLAADDGGHSDLQMDLFITAAHGHTPWGMYRQACREIMSRVEGLKRLYVQRRRLELKEAQGDGDGDSVSLKLRSFENYCEQDTVGRQIAKTERELRRFCAQAEALEPDMEVELAGLEAEEQASQYFHGQHVNDGERVEKRFWEERFKHEKRAKPLTDLLESIRRVSQDMDVPQLVAWRWRVSEAVEHAGSLETLIAPELAAICAPADKPTHMGCFGCGQPIGSSSKRLNGNPICSRCAEGFELDPVDVASEPDGLCRNCGGPLGGSLETVFGDPFCKPCASLDDTPKCYNCEKDLEPGGGTKIGGQCLCASCVADTSFGPDEASDELRVCGEGPGDERDG